MVRLSTLVVGLTMGVLAEARRIRIPTKGEACVPTTGCLLGLTCQSAGMGFVCIEQKRTNEPCDNDDHCLSGSCVENNDGMSYCACFNNQQCELEIAMTVVDKQKRYIKTKRSLARKAQCNQAGVCEQAKKAKFVKDMNVDNGFVCEVQATDDDGNSQILQSICMSGICDDYPNTPMQSVNPALSIDGLCQCSDIHKCQGGLPCETDSQCLYGSCVFDFSDWYGSGERRTCGCGNDNDCIFGFKCTRDGQSGKKQCIPAGSAGESCSSDNQCITGKCESRSCTCNPDTNHGCSSSELCNAQGTKCSSKKSGGEDCTNNVECLSSYCLPGSGVCSCGAAEPNTAPCMDGLFCDERQYHAVYGDITSPTSGIQCISKFLGGEPCENDGMCKSGKCKKYGTANTGKCECSENPLNEAACLPENTICSNNLCVPLRLEGDCTQTNNLCLSGECGSDNKCECREDSHCNGNRYCKPDGKCAWRKDAGLPCDTCDTDDGICECKAGACVDSDDDEGKICGCGSGAACPSGEFCNADMLCTDKIVGNGECSANSECSSGVCNDDKCSCSDNTHCAEGQVCDAGECKTDVNGECTGTGPDSTCINAYCVEGKCLRGRGGDPCSNDNHCRATCQDDKCGCDATPWRACLSESYYCTSTDDSSTYSNNEVGVCIQKQIGGGYPVDGATQCVTGETAAQFGTDYCKCDLNEQVGCEALVVLNDAGNQVIAPIDAFCNPNTNECVPKRKGGSWCGHYNPAIANSFCLSGSCVGNACTCSQNIDCADPDYYCNGSTCEMKKLGGAQCSVADECQSGTCDGGKCGCKRTGADSVNCEDTASTYCSDNGKCEPRLQGGAGCQNHYQCLGRCEGTSGNKECTCSSTAVCSTGHFCDSSQTPALCEPKRLIGQSCMFDAQQDVNVCATGKCMACNANKVGSGFFTGCTAISDSHCACKSYSDCPGNQVCLNNGRCVSAT